MASRRFSQAISEGDGISVVAEVADAASARRAESEGAEALVVRADLDGVRASTELPILWRATGSLADAARAGADACVLTVEEANDDGYLERLHAEAVGLGLDCVVEVHDEEQLELALERFDPEIFLLAAREVDDDSPLSPALELLPDVPAGKLAVAEVRVSSREQIIELERAGVDAVIVGAGNVAELVGDSPPPV